MMDLVARSRAARTGIGTQLMRTIDALALHSRALGRSAEVATTCAQTQAAAGRCREW